MNFSINIPCLIFFQFKFSSSYFHRNQECFSSCWSILASQRIPRNKNKLIVINKFECNRHFHFRLGITSEQSRWAEKLGAAHRTALFIENSPGDFKLLTLKDNQLRNMYIVYMCDCQTRIKNWWATFFVESTYQDYVRNDEHRIIVLHLCVDCVVSA